jgi:hypothetical protein
MCAPSHDGAHDLYGLCRRYRSRLRIPACVLRLTFGLMPTLVAHVSRLVGVPTSHDSPDPPATRNMGA